MKKRKLNEGLLDYFLEGLVMYAVKKNVQNDPEIKKFIGNYQKDLKKLTTEYEQIIANIKSGKY